MPVPNDLTPEEEQAFIEHGVEPSGPGMEPTGEPNQPVQEPLVNPHQDRVRDDSGRFTAKPEATAEPVVPAVPVAPVAEATAGGTPPAPAPEAPPPGFVPIAALHEARMKERTVAQQMATLQARTNALLANRQQQVEMPDLAKDPVAYVETLEARLAAFEASRNEEQQYRAIDNALDQDEQMFKMVTPDYHDASQHYVMSRGRELLLTNTPEQAQQIMLGEVRQIAQQAWQRGIPAAQMIYQYAESRGYVPNSGGQQQFQPATPAVPAAPAANAQSRVAAVAAGQQASRSLSGGTGGASVTELNATELLNMSDEEFEAHLKLGQKGANARFAGIGGM